MNEIRRGLSRTPIVSDTVDIDTGESSGFVLPEPIGPASQDFLPEPIVQHLQQMSHHNQLHYNKCKIKPELYWVQQAIQYLH